MSSDLETESNYNTDIDNLITQIGNIDINEDMFKDNNFINIKPNMEPEDLNPNITDIPSTSANPPPRNPRRTSAFDRTTIGYAGLAAKNENYTPFEKMKNIHINPFGIFLDLDCVSNLEEAIDKWETSLRIAVAVNHMDYETAKNFLEKTLVNSALRFWQNLDLNIKQAIYGTDENVANMITRSVEAIQLEFIGEGKMVRDPATILKYATALRRLQLCDM